MEEKSKSFLYNFDLIGVNPQLCIFNDKKYNSGFSSIYSVLIIIFTLFFSIYSLIDYLQFDSPNIIYYRDNDESTNRSLTMNDKLLMFQLIDSTTFNHFNDSITYFEVVYTIIYNNGISKSIPLNIVKCDFGKNVDYSYKSINEYLLGKSIKDFYCIDFNNINIDISLFYNQNLGFSFISLYVILKNESNIKPEKIQAYIVTENNILSHNDKNNPIIKSYLAQFTTSFSSVDFSSIMYYLQYIKYESDNGLFYKSIKSYNGVIFSDMVFYRKDMNDNYDINIKKTNSSDSIISTINIMLNKSNFDNYKRTFKRLQSLLAEVMSVIGLLFEIGRIISDILCDKKMSKDIIYKILNKIENEEINQEKNNINTNTHEENKKNFSSERKNIKNNFSLEKKNIENNFMNNTLNDLETEYNNKQKTTSIKLFSYYKKLFILF